MTFSKSLRARIKWLVYRGVTGACWTSQPFMKLLEVVRRDRCLRVLVYHRICDMPRETRHEYWNVPPAQFELQMHYLYSHGYNILTVGEAYRLIESGQPLPPKSVSVTFDDGYQNNYEFAYPILSKYGLRATVFLVYDYVSTHRAFEWVHWDDASLRVKEANPSIWEPLTWNQVNEMGKFGIEFGSHSLTHSRLTDLSLKELANELGQSKDKLEQRLGTEIIGFVSPFGISPVFKKTVRQLLMDIGYRYAFQGRIGSNFGKDDPYNWGRHSVYEKDSLEIFKRKLNGAYDWLGWVQPIWQRMFGA